jgi:4'-phosphopantetheinyl transferase
VHFVDIHLGKLPADEAKLHQFCNWLDAGERSRAAAFKNPLLHCRFVAVRGLLRCTLADYLQTDPASLRFTGNAHGKPALLDQPLFFNLSHTGDYLLIAVSDQPQIGVDIEQIRSRPGLADIAQRCFSTQELNHWQSLPENQRLALFYRLWTKKEAFVKAVGRGLALGLEHCALAIPDAHSFASLPAEYGTAADWQVHELAVDENQHPNLCGALVLPNAAFKLQNLPL